MKLKNFKDYLVERLDPKEIAQIEKQAKLEFQALISLQADISKVVVQYMIDEGIGFNELVRRLKMSSSQVIKIQKKEANLTLATIAHIGALLKKQPHIIFR